MTVLSEKHILPLLCSLVLAAAAPPPGFLGEGDVPGRLEEMDPECWDSSSLRLIQTKRLRVPATVGDLWDFMVFLKVSRHQKHNELFLDLAQLFWEMYVDCVLSRAHGLGRRHLVSGKFKEKHPHVSVNEEKPGAVWLPLGV